MANVVEVIRRHGVTLDVERPGAVTWSDGIASEAPPTTLQVQGVIQPLSPDERRTLPEGQDADLRRNVWSEAELKLGDRIRRSGQSLEVDGVEFWEEGGFYRAQAVLQKDTV